MVLTVQGQMVDLEQRKIYGVEIQVSEGRILGIQKTRSSKGPFLLPGFVDAHIHIESSMLVPSEFARMALPFGTLATVSDPHEIANVLGVLGVYYMIEDAEDLPLEILFGAPSCVPASAFETAGAHLDSQEVAGLLSDPRIGYLSEVMNYPGVIHRDPELMAMIRAAGKNKKPVDGHAPGLRGEALKSYFSAGIQTDHECFSYDEAREKLELGMKVIIREGSAAKNFEALIGLLNDWPDHMMFCSDDKHPDSLVLGHINQLCARAMAKGIDVFKVLKAACVNPVLHYKLDVGLLRVGDPADFIVVKDLANFEVLKTYINGDLVAENGLSHIKTSRSDVINNFSCNKKKVTDFETPWKGEKEIPVIEALDGQLITNRLSFEPRVVKGKIMSDPETDILKIAVVNRYRNAPVAISFIKQFGLKQGALASSVAHDSHNIVAVGTDDALICQAVNLVIAHKGGVSFSGNGGEMIVPLPVAGLMSNEDGYVIAEQYSRIDRAAKEAGSKLGSPFMTLSFMALLVIPHLKLSDRGLFDGDRFAFV